MSETIKPLHIVATGDVHGGYFPYDFLNDKPLKTGSLARVSQWVNDLRAEAGDDNVLLLDSGDLLQGGPAAYLCNRLSGLHPASLMMRYMGYDAMTVGNHDIETGHGVYDRFCRDVSPTTLLGANVLGEDGEEYFTPYTVLARGGRRVAVIGLLTPAVAEWVPEEARRGLTVKSMIDSARQLIDRVRMLERPDIIVGLFHSGYKEPEMSLSTLGENFSAMIADEVKGFDLIIMGHDHKPTIQKSLSGCLLANAGAGAEKVVHAVVSTEGTLTVSLTDMKNIEPDREFLTRFDSVFQSVKEYVSRPLGVTDMTFRSSEALKGPSAFMQVIHRAQLFATGARISLAAPPQSNAVVRPGRLTVADMYKFYRFDNGLTVLSLSGREIVDYLEWSYELRRPYLDPEADLQGASPVYNLDSAVGIDFTVDYSRPYGKRVEIHSLSDTGAPWDPDACYEVAMNSYRACGGGGHLTKGASIPPSALPARIIRTSPHTVRSAIEEYIVSNFCIE